MNMYVKAIFFSAAGFLSSGVMAHGTGSEGETVTPIAQAVVPPQIFKHATAVRVDYAPGATSTAHRHPGHVFVVVLSGEIESAVDGYPPQRFKAGEAWYESPGQLHRVSRNASNSEPASLVAWLLSDGKKELVQPVTLKK